MEKGGIKNLAVAYLREIIFGLEDSSVSTLGAVTGIAAGVANTYVVILSGLTILVVEAVSMAAGTYLSSKSANEAEVKYFARRKGHPRLILSNPEIASVVMGVCYVAGGAVPLVPYFLLPPSQAIWPSILMTALTLYLVGSWSSLFTGRPRIKSGLEMTGVSLLAAGIGYLVGRLVSYLFGLDI